MVEAVEERVQAVGAVRLHDVFFVVPRRHVLGFPPCHVRVEAAVPSAGCAFAPPRSLLALRLRVDHAEVHAEPPPDRLQFVPSLTAIGHRAHLQQLGRAVLLGVVFRRSLNPIVENRPDVDAHHDRPADRRRWMAIIPQARQEHVVGERSAGRRVRLPQLLVVELLDRRWIAHQAVQDGVPDLGQLHQVRPRRVGAPDVVALDFGPRLLGHPLALGEPVEPLAAPGAHQLATATHVLRETEGLALATRLAPQEIPAARRLREDGRDAGRRILRRAGPTLESQAAGRERRVEPLPRRGQHVLLELVDLIEKEAVRVDREQLRPIVAAAEVEVPGSHPLEPHARHAALAAVRHRPYPPP